MHFNISLAYCLFYNAEEGCGFASLVDAALHYKERLILSGKIHEAFFNFLDDYIESLDPSYYVKNRHLIYTANISLADVNIS
jgi:hypothetical protein